MAKKFLTDEQMQKAAASPKFISDEEMAGMTSTQPDPTSMSANAIRETPTYGGDSWTPTEMANVAKKHGVSEEFVKDMIPWSQGSTGIEEDWATTTGEVGKVIAGTVNKALGNIPSAIINKALLSEKQRKAWDDIRKISSKKLTIISDVANVAGMIGSGVQIAKGVGAAVAASEKAAAVSLAENPIGLALAMSLEGAASGAGEADVGETAKGAAFGAVVGGAIGGVLGLGAKFLRKTDYDKVSPKEYQKAANDAGINWNEHFEAVKESQGKLARDVERYVNDPTYRKGLSAELKVAKKQDVPRPKPDLDFQEIKIDSPKVKHLKAVRKYGGFYLSQGREGQPGLVNEFLTYKTNKAVFDKLDPNKISAFSNFFLSTIDNLQSAKLIDGKFGTFLETSLTSFSVKTNQAKNLIKKANELITKKTKVLKDTDMELDEAQLVGKTRNLTDADVKIKEMFEKLVTDVEEQFKVKIPRQLGFIAPRMLKTGHDWLGAVDKELQDLGINLVEVKKRGKKVWGLDDEAMANYNQLKNISEDASPETREAASRLKEVEEHVMNITGLKDEKDAIEAAFNRSPGARRPEEFDISRFMNRDDAALHAPLWALEKDVGVLASRWIRDVSQGLAAKDTLVHLNAVRNLAEKARDGGTSQWVGDLISDLKGVPRTTTTKDGVQAITVSPANLQGEFLHKIAANSVLRLQKNTGMDLINKTGVLLPHMVNMVTRAAYPGLLSKPVSFFKNVASPVFSSMPYLASSGVGIREATAITFKSFIDATRHVLVNGKGDSFFTKLNNMRVGDPELLKKGLIAPSFSGEQTERLASEIVSNLKKDSKWAKAYGVVEKGEEISSKTLLAFFQASETFARVWTMNMSKNLSERMARNPSFGKKVLLSSDSPRMRDGRWAKQGIPERSSPQFEDFQTEMIEHINANTMFNYDKANMSGYGRYMGPLFSQFSKWPTMILGKTVVPFQTEEARQAAARFTTAMILPLVIGYTADKVIKSQGLEDEARYQALFGSLQSYAPASALGDVFGRDGFRPPAVQLAIGTLNFLSEPAKLAQDVWDYSPFGGVEKAVLSGAAIITGKKQEGISKPFTKQLGRTLRESLQFGEENTQRKNK